MSGRGHRTHDGADPTATSPGAAPTPREAIVAVLNLSTEQLDGLLNLARLCRGDRDPFWSLVNTLLEERRDEAVD